MYGFGLAALYLALLLWQVVWHALLPEPYGAQNWGLAMLCLLPLLLPLPGILRRLHRSQVWGSYLGLLYFCIGIMEAWSNPGQRFPALLQVGLVAMFWTGLTHKVLLERRANNAAGGGREGLNHSDTT